MSEIRTCGKDMNCISTIDMNNNVDIKPLKLKEIHADQNTLQQKIIQVVLTIPRTELIQEVNLGHKLYIHFTCRTFLGFIDDLEIMVNRNQIDIRSASRVGYYDFGVNKKRYYKVKKLLEQHGLLQ